MSEGAKVGWETENEDTQPVKCYPGLPLGREMPGGFVQYEVEDVNAAVRLAEQFKVAGKHRYFRGQSDANWELTSSLSRKSRREQAREQEKIVAFAAWVRSADRRVPYLDTDDKIIATAQHYQLASTTFTDFTTNPTVAGWFASEGGSLGQKGAIFLANPDEVRLIFEAISRSGPAVRFLQFDVPNLWRLQSQSGLFLEARCDIASLWPFDRIVFIQTGTKASVSKCDIYPDRKSHLEQMIDNFRQQQAREAGLRNFIASGVLHVRIEHPLGDRLPRLDASSLKSSWNAGPNETWNEVDRTSSPPSWSVERIQNEHRKLVSLIAKRRDCTDLLVINPDLHHRNGTVQDALELLWSGLRPHPYSPKQIANSLKELFRLLVVFGDYPFGNGKSHEPEAKRLMTDPVEIEMGIAGGGSVLAFVASAELYAALSRSARTKLGMKRSVKGDVFMRALDQFYGATLDLFDAQMLIELFASSIVPWQIATQRSPICFAATHLETLGRP